MSDADYVQVNEGATAYLQVGATVVAAEEATVTGWGPGIAVRSIGEGAGYTVYSAQAAGPSGVRRRAATPQVTCGPLMSDCPVLGGSTRCTDIKQDIFSGYSVDVPHGGIADSQDCGGCALDGRGVDCTSLEGGGDLVCVKGQCVAVA